LSRLDGADPAILAGSARTGAAIGWPPTRPSDEFNERFLSSRQKLASYVVAGEVDGLEAGL